MHIKNIYIAVLGILLLSVLLCTPPASRHRIKKTKPDKLFEEGKNTSNSYSNPDTIEDKMEDKYFEDDYEEQTDDSNIEDSLHYIAKIYKSKGQLKNISKKYKKMANLKIGLFKLPGPYKLSFSTLKAKTVSKKKLKLLKQDASNLEIDYLFKNKFYTLLYYKKQNKTKYKIYPLVFSINNKKYLLSQIFRKNEKIAFEGTSKKFYYFDLLNQDDLDNFLQN